MIPLRSPVSPGVLFLAILAYFVVRNVVVTGSGMLLLRTRLAQVRRVYQRGYGKGQLASELRAGLLVLVFDAVAVWSVRMLGLHAFVPSSLRVDLFTFALLFVWFEGWFYATHRLMHTKALYPIHARHTGHYGLFVPLLDQWFGTQWEDYPEVQARAARGEGLQTLGERVGVAERGVEGVGLRA